MIGVFLLQYWKSGSQHWESCFEAYHLKQSFSLCQATGAQLGLVIAGIVTIVSGLVVAFDASWRLTLVMIAFTPLLLVAGMAVNTFFGGGSAGEGGAAAGCGQVSSPQSKNV